VYPKLYSENYVNKDDVITVSSGDDTKSYLYDRKKNTQWVSVGETDENGDYSTFIEVEFMQDGYSPAPVSRTFDTFVLLNTNLKEFKLQYWTGSSWQDIPETITTSNGNSTVIIHFIGSPIGSFKVRLLMDKTITPNQEKAIGEMLVMSYKFQLKDILMGHNRKDWEKSDHYRLADGTLETWFEVSKFALTQSLKNVNETLRNELKDLKDEREDFYIYPDGDIWPDEFYLVHWLGEWTQEYRYKIGRYTIEFAIEET
jgi:hypothetical protein